MAEQALIFTGILLLSCVILLPIEKRMVKAHKTDKQIV